MRRTGSAGTAGSWPRGATLGGRPAAGLPLSGEEDRRLELGEPRVGTFADALGALTERGTVYADRLYERVLAPFVLDTCRSALERARNLCPDELAELLEEVGEDGSDPMAVVRAAEWEAPLRIEAERLALAALGELPLIEVEAEGLSLSLVRAAEDVARSAAPVETPAPAKRSPGPTWPVRFPGRGRRGDSRPGRPGPAGAGGLPAGGSRP